MSTPTPPGSSSTSVEPADRELLDRLARGDAAALDIVLARFWSPLVTYLHGVLDSRDAAADVAQETFFRLWEHRTRLRPDGSLRGFLYRVGRNLAISEQRRARSFDRNTSEMRHEEPTVITLDADGEDDGLHRALERAVRALPERRREILLLHSVHGLTYKEIARLLGIAPQTVANQCSAALASLRRALSDVGPGNE